MKTFQEISDFLAEIPNIDFGGCGIAAYVLSKFTDSYELVFLDNEEESAFYNAKILQGEYPYEIWIPDHIGLKVNGTILDCNGKIIEKDFQYIQCGFSESYLVKMIKSSYWNTDFDRKQFIPEIEKFTGINLSWAM